MTVKIPDEVRAAMVGHARSEYPKEACGLLVLEKGRVHYVPCQNVAKVPGEQFAIDPDDFERAEDRGEILLVFHSHPNASEQPSAADRVACIASGLPWLILSVPGGKWADVSPEYATPPLYGREFVHGLTDCYGFIRDWYSQELGITLMQHAREDEWWKKGQNLYLENFREAKFTHVTDGSPPQVGDVLLMQVCADVPNHGAVYLGDDRIGHHLYGRLSSRDVYGGYYKKHTTHLMRYTG